MTALPLDGEDLQVSVVLPCLDEAPSVAACIDEARRGLATAGFSGEVLVVDNGSRDGSADLALEAGARVVSEAEPGYGNALRSGINEARGRIVVMADADRTYDLSRVGELIGPVAAGRADIVVGGRLDGANRGTMPFLHRFVGTPILSFLLRRAGGGLRIRDSQSGYRAMDAEPVRRLGLQATGMEFASEMLIRASQEGLRVVEKPLGYRPRVGDSKLSRIRDGWRHLQLIFLLAPQLLLFWPGLALLAGGLLLSVITVMNPLGLDIGPLRWQPVFFAPILIVLGAMAALSGAVITHHSPLIGSGAARGYSVVGSPRFPIGCITAGGTALGAGLAIDLALFVVWITGEPAPERALALAGLAQALVITGASLAAFGFVYRVLVRQTGYRDRAAVPETAKAAVAAGPARWPGGQA